MNSDREEGWCLLSGDRVQGWGAIAMHISRRTGLKVSTASVVRWARREHDPLPVRRWGGGRPRIIANGQEIDAWCDRQWVDTVDAKGRETEHGPVKVPCVQVASRQSLDVTADCDDGGRHV